MSSCIAPRNGGDCKGDATVPAEGEGVPIAMTRPPVKVAVPLLPTRGCVAGEVLTVSSAAILQDVAAGLAESTSSPESIATVEATELDLDLCRLWCGPLPCCRDQPPSVPKMVISRVITTPPFQPVTNVAACGACNAH